jgi:hypothetical protein
MERSMIKPHISWSGPQPDRETDAYLLAMLLRIYSSGFDSDDRDTMMAPSILTTDNLHLVSIMYAFYKDHMEDKGVRNTEAMLKLIKSLELEAVEAWLPDNAAAVSKAEAELIEFVETKENKGFSSWG